MPSGRRKTGRSRVRWMKGTQYAVTDRVVIAEEWIKKREWRLGNGQTSLHNLATVFDSH
jgi:hypothetical protein